MNVSRRSFLLGSVATCCIGSVPSGLTAAAPPPAASAVVSSPQTTMWVGGHLGEFDWQVFNAPTKEEAAKQLMAYFGQDYRIDGAPYSLEDAYLAIERAEGMDGLQPDEVRGAHWIKSGFGSHCCRCGGETCADNGAYITHDDEVVCDDCAAISEIALSDPGLAREKLEELLIDLDCDIAGAKARLSLDDDVSLIPENLWTAALLEASKYV